MGVVSVTLYNREGCRLTGKAPFSVRQHLKHVYVIQRKTKLIVHAGHSYLLFK